MLRQALAGAGLPAACGTLAGTAAKAMTLNLIKGIRCCYTEVSRRRVPHSVLFGTLDAGKQMSTNLDSSLEGFP